IGSRTISYSSSQGWTKAREEEMGGGLEAHLISRCQRDRQGRKPKESASIKLELVGARSWGEAGACQTTARC
ncbi:hypothetical protein Bpfe_005845, partial [Biomphalaria pfeifferi]